MHLPLIAMALCLIPGRPTTSPVADIERMRSEFAHAVELLDRSNSESLAQARATPEYQQSAAELEQLQAQAASDDRQPEPQVRRGGARSLQPGAAGIAAQDDAVGDVRPAGSVSEGGRRRGFGATGGSGT